MFSSDTTRELVSCDEVARLSPLYHAYYDDIYLITYLINQTHVDHGAHGRSYCSLSNKFSTEGLSAVLH
jgi:hypothetical protein